MAVYAESNRSGGRLTHVSLSDNERLILAEQDFYAYLLDFFADPDAMYAVWAPEGRYAAALRIERYRDGYLITGLETMPEMRRKGNAGKLIGAVLNYLSRQGSIKVYSHVDKRNAASIAVHIACGFERILEYAVYLDGSVLPTSCTLCYMS